MSREQTVEPLNTLLAILYRSLPLYLSDADPWTARGRQQATAALAQIVEDQRRDCGRLAELILQRGGRVESGKFPMEYTDLHFLSLDYLIGELIRHQKLDIASIERCVAQLSGDPEARTLAEEILGSERAHLETLEDLARQYSASNGAAPDTQAGPARAGT